jgi:hypothetical protein
LIGFVGGVNGCTPGRLADTQLELDQAQGPNVGLVTLKIETANEVGARKGCELFMDYVIFDGKGYDLTLKRAALESAVSGKRPLQV